MKNEENNIKPYPYVLTPFKMCVLQNFPFIEQDFDSLTNYGLLCKVVEYLNNVIANQNIVQDNVTTLNNYVTTLNNYVNSYFDNLDVQDEINKKLDEMATDGTLDKIINQEIFGQINTQLNQNTSDIKILKNKKYIFFGDSYASGEIGTSWLQNIVNYLGLAGTDYINASRNGYGFTYPSSTQNWESVLDSIIETTTNKEEYTDILVAGGYNDGAPYNSSSQEQIESAIQSFITKCKANFPNATIRIAHIGWTGNMDNFAGLRKSIQAYKNCTQYGATYINNSEFIMHNYTLYLNDYFHPNENGNKNIAKYLINGLISGSCDVYYEVPITLTNKYTLTLSHCEVISITHNEITTIEFRNKDNNNVFIQSNNNNDLPLVQYVRRDLFEMGNNLSTCYAGNHEYQSNTQLIYAYYIDTDNNSGIIPMFVDIDNYKFYFINLETTKQIKFLGLQPFSIKQLSLYC